MFYSSNGLVHLLFANEADTYYGDDLLQLGFRQKLWLTLREADYDCVYFLKQSGEMFSVTTFGEPNAQPFAENAGGLKGFLFGKSKFDSFLEWMRKRLVGESGKEVIVCSLEDFLNVVGGWPNREEVKKALREIEQREHRGVLVLTASPVVERSRRLLMDTTLLDLRNDSAGEGWPLYADTTLNVPAVFWNTFSQENVRNIVAQATARNSITIDGHALTKKQIDDTARYLTRYLNDEELWFGRPIWKEFATPGYDMKFSELYTLLTKPGTWRVLAVNMGGNDTSYRAESRRCPVQRDRGSEAGRCLRQQLPAWTADTAYCASFRQSLLQIRRSLLEPKCCAADNAELSQKLSAFGSRLSSVRYGDTDTCRRALDAMQFCAARLHFSEGSREAEKAQEIANLYESLVDASDQVFDIRGKRLQREKSTVDHLTSKLYETLCMQEAAMGGLVKKCEDTIKNALNGIDISATSVEEFARTAEQGRRRLEKLLYDEQTAPAPVEPEPAPVSEPAEPEPEEAPQRVVPQGYQFVPREDYLDMSPPDF